MPLCSRKLIFTNGPATLLVKDSGPPSYRSLSPPVFRRCSEEPLRRRERELSIRSLQPTYCHERYAKPVHFRASRLSPFSRRNICSARHTQAHIFTLPVHVDVGSPLPAPQPRTMRRFGPNASAVIFRLFPLQAEADLVRYESRVCLFGFDEPNRRNH